MKGALDEAMEIMKGSLADNSMVEQSYRTTGQIDVNDAGDIINIYVKGILVDFNIHKFSMGPEVEYTITESKIESTENEIHKQNTFDF